jgi:hypothetical protein
MIETIAIGSIKEWTASLEWDLLNRAFVDGYDVMWVGVGRERWERENWSCL